MEGGDNWIKICWFLQDFPFVTVSHIQQNVGKTDREGLCHRGCRARAGDSQFNVREAQETVPLLQSKFPLSPDQDSQFEDAVIYLALHTIRLSVSLITCQDLSEFFPNHARSSSFDESHVP